MSEEREPGGKKPEKRKKEKRPDKERKKATKSERGKQAVTEEVIQRAEKLEEKVEEIKLPEAEKRQKKEELEDIKEKAKRRERNFIEELIKIIELNVELNLLEGEITEAKAKVAWEEFKKPITDIEKALKSGRITQREASKQAETLFERVVDKQREEGISNQKFYEMVGDTLTVMSDNIGRVGGRRSDYDDVKRIIAEERGEELTPEEDRHADYILRSGGRLFSTEDLTKIASGGAGAEEAIERIFNEVYEVIDATPEAPWNEAITLEDSIRLATLKRYLLRMGDRGEILLRKFGSESELRRHLHTLFYAVEKAGAKPAKLAEYVGTFGNELRNTLFKLEGADTAARFYEAGFEWLLDRYGYVPYGKVVYQNGESELEDWVKTQFKKYLYRSGGYASQEDFDKDWPAWKIRRALSVGKGHGLLTLRLMEIAARGRLPLGHEERNYSPWAEDYVRALDPGHHLFEKFGQGGPGLAILHFIISGGKEGKFLTPEQFVASLKDFARADPDNRRFLDRFNFITTGGPLTNSKWRGLFDVAHVPGEKAGELYQLGTNLASLVLRDRLGEHKAKDPKELEEFKEKLKDEIKNLWEIALNRDALQVIRQAEIPDEVLEDFLKKLIPDIDDKERKQIFEQIKKFRPDERMQHLVLIDFLKQTRPNVKSGTWEFGTWKREKYFKVKRDILDVVENEYILLRENAVHSKDCSVNLSLVRDPNLRKQVAIYLASVEKIARLPSKLKGEGWSILKNLVEKTIKGEFTLGLSNADAAWADLDFSAEGHIALVRRIRDFGIASDGVGKLAEMLNHFGEYQTKPMAFVAEVKELVDLLAGAGRGMGTEAAKNLCEGFIRACDGDWRVKWLPFPLDRIVNMFTRNSYAERMLGEGALAMTVVDKRNLINQFRLLGMFNDINDPTGLKIAKGLYKRLGAQWWRVGIEFIWKYGPLAIFFIFWQIWKEYEEKSEQAMKG